MGSLVFIAQMVANWFVYEKMGRKGWEGIVPFYNTYVLFEELYGNGWKFLLLLIPIYNIYLLIKCDIDFAKAFGQGTGFVLGIIFLPTVFQLIIAFSNDMVWTKAFVKKTQPQFCD